MTENWFIGIDGSSTARAALRWAVAHAPSRGAHLTLVHVAHDNLVHRALSKIRRDEPESSTADAQVIHELDPAVAGIVGDLPVDYRTLVGSASKQMAADHGDVTLRILGRHGAGTRWLQTLGSVSRYCATHSSVPVVLVPDDWEAETTQRVTVGFDGSTNSAAAVDWAIRFAAPDTQVHALLALDIAPWLPADVAEVRLKGELHQHETDLRARLDDVDPLGRARRDVVVGDARVALARASERSDLLVIGARGAGRLGPTLLGSVSTWLLDASGCPMVVVPATT